MSNASTFAAAVNAEMKAIEALEGPFHCEGWFIRDPHLCERQRKLVAERRVSAMERRLAACCPWCEQVVTADEIATELGGRRLHARCAVAFGAFTYGEESADEWAPCDPSDVAVWESDAEAPVPIHRAA
jgi:hypothetical protein